MTRLEAIIRADPDLMAILERVREIKLPQWRIVSGCLYQTVWNVLTNRPRGTGIQDYDVIYFDAGDLSWEAEDAVITSARSKIDARNIAHSSCAGSTQASRAATPVLSALSTLPTPADPRAAWLVRAGVRHAADKLQIRNQARVHLWYEQHFGVSYAPLHSADESLTRYPVTVQAVGARLENDGRLDIIAPFGLDDLFGMVMRPNALCPHRPTFEAKAARALAIWPETTVIDRSGA